MNPAAHPDTAPARTPSAPLPMGMLYTLLRYGHGLSHDEASSRIDAALDRVSDQTD